MAQIIDFGAWKQAKRVEAAKAVLAEGEMQRVIGEKVAIAADLMAVGLVKDLRAAAFVANAMVEKAEALKAEKLADRMPAYCDPANEFRGAKFEAVRSLDVKEIAKRMRADVKALKLPAGFKVRIWIERFAGGQSIDLRVDEVPEGFKFWSVKMAAWRKQFGDNFDHRAPLRGDEQHSAEYNELRGKLDAIYMAYKRDNSDSQSDYFNVNFYGSVGFAGDWAALKAEAADAPADYWAPDANQR